MNKILYVYKWATMGGVERVLLNRAWAFKKHNVEISQHIYFYHDSGGKALLQNYIEQHELHNYLEIVETLNVEVYDYIHTIDTPEIFDSVKESHYHKLIFECHTAYRENRGFLKKLPEKIKALVVPSPKFIDEIVEEVSAQIVEKTYVLNNFVPDIPIENGRSLNKQYNKTLISYIGRVDKLKNVEEIIEIFLALQKKLGDKFLLLIAGPLSPEVDFMKVIHAKGLTNRLIYFPSIPFANIPMLLEQIKQNKGIFVSASKGESFGLSVAEAIISEIPVVVSDVHSHLVAGDELFLYELGNVGEAVEKITYALQYEEVMLERVRQHKENLNERRFMEDWGTLYSIK